MDIKTKIEEIVNKIQKDPKLMDKFQKNPTGAIEELIGVDLPDDQINGIVNGDRVFNPVFSFFWLIEHIQSAIIFLIYMICPRTNE